MKYPDGLKGRDLHRWMKENKSTIIASKKASVKHADAVLSNYFVDKDGCITKDFTPVVSQDVSQLRATLIINTTNLLDSHEDVHIPGLWNKSTRENKYILHVESHLTNNFSKIISDNVTAFTKKYSWRELGYDANGITEALVFDSLILKDRNPFMFDMYRKGWVKQHSVGMRYVQLFMAINESDDKYFREEYEVWEKYFPQIVNQKDAEEIGYFFAVTEAKVIEGSAVPLGSNWVTPTQSIIESTKDQPVITTDFAPQFDFEKALSGAKFINF